MQTKDEIFNEFLAALKDCVTTDTHIELGDCVFNPSEISIIYNYIKG